MSWIGGRGGGVCQWVRADGCVQGAALEQGIASLGGDRECYCDGF